MSVRRAVALDRAVGVPAAVARGLDRGLRESWAAAAGERDEQAVATAGLELHGAGALGDGQQHALALAELAVTDRQPLLPVGQRSQAGDVALDVLDAHVALFDEPDQAPEIHARGEQQRPCGGAVAPAPAGLLVVGLEARRQRPVRDRAHVRLVDTHAECVGRDDHLGAAVHERRLAVAACLRGHAGVIGDGVDACLRDPRGDLVGVLARAAVDDRRQRGVRGLAVGAGGEGVHQRGALARYGALALDADDVERQGLGGRSPIEPTASR